MQHIILATGFENHTNVMSLCSCHLNVTSLKILFIPITIPPGTREKAYKACGQGVRNILA